MYKDMTERERECRFCTEEKKNIKVAKICINVAFCSTTLWHCIPSNIVPSSNVIVYQYVAIGMSIHK